MYERIKKTLCRLMTIAALLSVAIGAKAYARDDTQVNPISTEDAVDSNTIIGPDGNVYYYLCTVSSGQPSENHLSIGLKDSIIQHLALYCPNNDRLDLVQGTVEFLQGLQTIKTFSFLNFYNEIILSSRK